jgi:zinc protease
VIVTRDAQGLRDALVSDAVSSIKYESPKPEEILAEDKIIEKFPLPVSEKAITIVPVDQMFEK